MRKPLTRKLLLWVVRVSILPFALFWIVLISQVISNYWSGGLPAVESWYYWHVVMLGVQMPHTPGVVFHQTNYFWLGNVLMLIGTEALLLVQWLLSKRLKQGDKRPQNE